MHALLGLALASLALATATPPSWCQDSERLPNVVLIEWNGPDAELYGLPAQMGATPRLDALLAGGARFPGGMQVGQRGLPSSAVLLSGLHPHETGAHAQLGAASLDAEKSLGMRLRSRGYSCLYVGRFRAGKPEAFGFGSHVRQGIAEGAEPVKAFIEEFGKEHPLFIWWAPDLPRNQGIEALDEGLGGVLDALATSGELENTLFAFTTNGDPRGLEFSSRECSAEQMRSPIALVWDARIPAAEHPQRVTSLDLFPTLLDFIGLGIPEEARGHSLRDLIEGKPWEERPIGAAFFESTAGQSRAARGMARDLLALMHLDGPWKYTLFLQDVGVKVDPKTELVEIEHSAGDQTLFELGTDPEESRDLFSDPEHVERLSTMRAAALAWWQANGGEDLTLPFLPPALGPPPTEARPNIVLIISDDMDYEHLGFMGNEIVKTPTLDELAHEGVVFPVAHVPMSRCRPALATLLSGRWPHQTGILENVSTGTLSRRDSLPNLLKAAGYATFVGGKFWEGSQHSMGFIEPESLDTVFQTFVRENQDELFHFVDRYHEERPFFLWWAPMLPHGPFNPPERHQALYADAEIPVPPFIQGDPAAYQEAERTFYAMDSWLDEGLATLRKKLAEVGELDNTLFVFLIDNGYANGHPSKGTAFEKGLRTPVFFSWPKGIQGGRVRPELVCAVDLYQTILDYAGVASPPETAGISLRPLLDGGEQTTRSAIHGALHHRHKPAGRRRAESEVYALYARTERWKFVLYLRDVTPEDYLFFHEFAPFPARERGTRNLYDLLQDPYEQNDLSGVAEHEALMGELMSGCLTWWHDTGGVALDLEEDTGDTAVRKKGRRK